MTYHDIIEFEPTPEKLKTLAKATYEQLKESLDMLETMQNKAVYYTLRTILFNHFKAEIDKLQELLNYLVDTKRISQIKATNLLSWVNIMYMQVDMIS